jgi:hypothetical protein
MHGCLDCGAPLSKSLVDHPYRYDRGRPIWLRSITKLSCKKCDYYEIEIPRMGPLHEAISQSLHVLRVGRDAIAFFFKKGKRGVEDGEWGVSIRSAGKES